MLLEKSPLIHYAFLEEMVPPFHVCPSLDYVSFFSLMEVDYLLSGLLGPILSTTTIIWSTAKEDAADAHNV